MRCRVRPSRCAWTSHGLVPAFLQQTSDISGVCGTDAYRHHPVVQAHQNAGKPLPLPIGLYVDGVRYTSEIGAKTDNLLAFWLINLLTMKRHLIGFVRSSDICRCGCRGWCTLWPILKTIQWFCLTMVAGKTLDRGPFGEIITDGWYVPNDPLLFYGVLLWIKGDWAEHSKTLGLMSWAASVNPCSLCHCSKAELHTKYARVSALSLPWVDKTSTSYDAACNACEVVVRIVSDGMRQLLYTEGQLKPMRRKKGPSGLVLLGGGACHGTLTLFLVNRNF